MAHKEQLSVSLMFSSHFDLNCDLLLYRLIKTWNLFIFLLKKELKMLMVMLSVCLSSKRSLFRTNQSV